jgi:hypothetical protein
LESPTTISGVTTSYYLLTGLSGSTQYYIKVIPYRDNTTGDYSTTLTVTTTAVDPSANTYKHVFFFGVDSSSQLNWTRVITRGSTHKLNGIFNSDNDTVVTDLSGRPYIFTGPTANTEYYIRTTPYISAGFLR